MSLNLLTPQELSSFSYTAYCETIVKILRVSSTRDIYAQTRDGITLPFLGLPKNDATLHWGRPGNIPWSIVNHVMINDFPDGQNKIKNCLSNNMNEIDIKFDESYFNKILLPQFNISPSMKHHFVQFLSSFFSPVHIGKITVHLNGGDALPWLKDLLLEALKKDASVDYPPLFHLGYDPFVLGLRQDGSWSMAWDETKDTLLGLSSFAAVQPESMLLAARGQIWHALGATEVQELAIALATGVAYLDLWNERGGENGGAAWIAPRLAFHLVADQSLLTTIAKLRAFRRLWALVLEYYEMTAQPAFVYAEQAWRMMTRRDPWTNILRATLAVFGAAIGGADAVMTYPHTAILGGGTQGDMRLANTLQAILLHESHLHKVADPVAGAGGVEELTEALARAAWAEFQTIAREGGLVKSLQNGSLRMRLAAADAAQRDAVARRRIPILGTSLFPHLQEISPVAGEGPPLPPPAPGAHRLAEPFESLRDQADEIAREKGRRPRVLLLPLSEKAVHAAESKTNLSVFEIGGIESHLTETCQKIVDVKEVLLQGEWEAVCLLVGDDTLAAFMKEVVTLIRQQGVRIVWVMGSESLNVQTLDVDGFIDEGADIPAVLGGFYAALTQSPQTSSASFGKGEQ